MNQGYRYRGSYIDDYGDDSGEGCVLWLVFGFLLVIIVVVGVYFLAVLNTHTLFELDAAEEQTYPIVEPVTIDDEKILNCEQDRDQLILEKQQQYTRIISLEQNLEMETQLRKEEESKNHQLLKKLDELTLENEGLLVIRDIAVAELQWYHINYPLLENQIQTKENQIQILEDQLRVKYKSNAAYSVLEKWFGTKASIRWSIISLGSIAILTVSLPKVLDFRRSSGKQKIPHAQMRQLPKSTANSA